MYCFYFLRVRICPCINIVLLWYKFTFIKWFARIPPHYIVFFPVDVIVSFIPLHCCSTRFNLKSSVVLIVQISLASFNLEHCLILLLSLLRYSHLKNFSSLTRDWTHVPWLEGSLNHWITREVSTFMFLKNMVPHPFSFNRILLICISLMFSY